VYGLRIAPSAFAFAPPEYADPRNFLPQLLVPESGSAGTLTEFPNIEGTGSDLGAGDQMEQQTLDEMINHQLPYEVDMLRATFSYLSGGAVLRVIFNGGVVNAFIESFCIHARNLIEFFEQQSTTPKNVAGSRHFTLPSYVPFKMRQDHAALTHKLNNQITHLTYRRTTKDEEKIGDEDRAVLLQLLELEIERFSTNLRDRYRQQWPERMRSHRIRAS
jgi:hypothetical protein